MDQGQDRKLPAHIFVRTFFRELKQGDSITQMYCVIRNAYDTEWSFSILAKVDTLQIYTAGNGTHVKNVKVTSICRRYYNVEV